MIHKANLDQVELAQGENYPVAFDQVEHTPPFVRSAFNYNRDLASIDSGLYCPEPTMAEQQWLEDSDINTIVRRFGLTGEMPTNAAAPAYGDFDEVTDYHTSLNMIKAADEAFMRLPADVRYRFANDPQRLMEFFSDPANRPEAEKMGLVKTLKQADPALPTNPTPQPPNTPQAGHAVLQNVAPTSTST